MLIFIWSSKKISYWFFYVLFMFGNHFGSFLAKKFLADMYFKRPVNYNGTPLPSKKYKSTPNPSHFPTPEGIMVQDP